MAETPADAAAIVYAEQLVPNGHGLPLWCPEPTRFGEVLIGDVGHIDSGQFIRLFNATLPANHPVNRAGVPDNFVQLRYDEQTLEHTQHNYLSPGAVYNNKSTSCSVQAGIGVSAPTMTLGGKYSFSCRASRGAIAMLGGPGHRHRVLDNKFFREYISRHHDSWHKLAQARGLMVSAESIILVYGWVKTSNWALAVSSSNATSHDISCEIPSGTCASAIFRVAVSNFSVPAVEQRSGPKDLDGADPPSHTPTTYDQCLFLRYYKRKTRWFLDDVISTRVVAKDARSKEQDTKLAASSSSVHTIEGRKKDNTFARAKQLLATTESASDADVGQLAENPVHQHAALDDQIESIPSIESAGTYDKALDALLGHILANSQACSAIVTHDDLYHLFPNPQQWPTDISASLDTMRPTVLVNDLGVGELSFALGGLEQPLGSPSRHLSSQTEHPTPGNIVTPPASMLPSPAPYGHSSLASNNVVDDGRHRETSTKSASSPNIGSRQVAFAPTIDFDTLSTSQLSDGDSSAPMQNLQTLPLVIPDLSSLIPQLQLASSAGSHDNQYPYRSSSPNARLSARRQGFATISSPPAATTGSVSHPGQSTQGYLGSQYLHSDQSVTPSIPVRSGHYRRSSSGSREHSMAGQSSGSGAQEGPHATPQPGYRVPALRISTPTQHHVPEYHMGGPPMDIMEPGMTTIGSAIGAMTVPRVSVTADASQKRRKVPANFPCPIPDCGSTFTRHFNLKMHLRTHAEEKPYQCTWPGCGKGFAREQDCERHEQLHLNVRPYQCEGCKKNFARLDALNRHLRSEGGAECRKVQRELDPDGDEGEVGEPESDNTAGPSSASQPEPDADWEGDAVM